MNRQIILNQDLLAGQSPEGKDALKRLDECAQLLSALADANRLKIISALMNGPDSVSGIATTIECDISTTSHHLKVLKGAGLVHVKRDGKLQIHSLRPGFATPAKGKADAALNLGCCTIKLPSA